MADRLTQEASKYAGKIKVGSGPVPLQRWTDKSRPGAGEDLRGEETPHPPENQSALPATYRGKKGGDR